MEDTQLSKYFTSESQIVMRSTIHLADYNPRKIDASAKKALKRGIKKFGLVGGIVVNKRTGMTIVSGHQRISVMDELHGYDPTTKENDYAIRVDIVDLEEKQEMELNILANNANAQGTWDYSALAAIVPDIDYKDAGLTDADLSMIGLDYLYKTEQQNSIENELADLMQPAQEAHEEEMAQRAAEREAIKEASRQAEELAQQEMSREERVQHMKDVKQQVREAAMENAKNMDAYLVLSFDTFQAKAEFCQRFGYNAMERMIKGEDFDQRCEYVGFGEDYEDEDDV